MYCIAEFFSFQKHGNIEILLLSLVIADTANRIVSEIISCFKDGNWKPILEWVGFVGPLFFYFIAGIIAILYDCSIIRRNIKQNNNAPCTCKGTCNWHTSGEWAKLAVKLFAFLGGGLYFAGDNLKSIKDRPLTSLTLSVGGVVMLRSLTHGLRTLQHYCEPNQRTPNTYKYNYCSPNHDRETHALVVVYMHLLTFLIEFDTVLSVVQHGIDNETLCNSTDRNSMDRRTLVWFFYGTV